MEVKFCVPCLATKADRKIVLNAKRVRFSFQNIQKVNKEKGLGLMKACINEL